MSKKALMLFIIFSNIGLAGGRSKTKKLVRRLYFYWNTNRQRIEWQSLLSGQITFAKNIPITYRLHEKGVPNNF